MMAKKITLRSGRKWLETDLIKLVELLQDGMPVAKVAKLLSRSEAAIRVQATLRRVSASSNLAQRAKRNEELRR